MWACQCIENLPRSDKISRYPLRKPRRHFSAAGDAGASKVAAPPVLPLVEPFPAALAQATTPLLAPIKTPPETPKLVAPNTNSGKQSPAREHTTAPPYCPNQPSHHLPRLTPRLHSRSPCHLPRRTVATTIRTRRRLCATIAKPSQSTPSPRKTSNRCGFFPSCLSHFTPHHQQP
jgi:hypothetical protein